MKHILHQIETTLGYLGHVCQISSKEETIFIPFGNTNGSAKECAKHIRRLPLPPGVGAKTLILGNREYVVIHKK